MSLESILKAATISAEMIERRDRCKQVYGNAYPSAVNVAKAIITANTKQGKLSILEAALKICVQAVKDGNGSAVNLIIAGAVELCEEAQKK